MTEEDLAKLPADQWMPSRIPLRDALATFVPDASAPEPVMEEMSKRCGESVWYIVENGHRVLFLHDGGPFDASRFTLEPKAWDHEHYALCSAHIPAMTLCHVTKPGQPYFTLCVSCYENHIIAKQ
jgi:hypothetical protein